MMLSTTTHPCGIRLNDDMELSHEIYNGTECVLFNNGRKIVGSARLALFFLVFCTFFSGKKQPPFFAPISCTLLNKRQFWLKLG